MITDVQTKALSLGKEGCYFCSICYIAETEGAGKLDLLRIFDEAISSGLIQYNGYVLKPDALIQRLTGDRWEVFKAGADHPIKLDYVLQKGEREILRYEYNKVAHFVVGNGNQKIEYNPYLSSIPTIKGYLISRRIFRRIDKKLP